MTVLRRGVSATRFIHWDCRCRCGKEVTVQGGNLTSGNSKSCGCLQREIQHERSEANKLRPFEAAYNNLKRMAKLMNADVQISYEKFLGYTKVTVCHYCGEVITWKPQGIQAYRLDRKDPKVGYLEENLVVCCARCNLSKTNRYTHDEWLCMAQALQQLKLRTTKFKVVGVS